MNIPGSKTIQRLLSRRDFASAMFWLSLVMVPCIFISSVSFWIDEGNTAYRAAQPTLVSWFKAMVAVTGSDAQMPGYMIYVWFWHKLVGNSEFLLRLSNLPWLVIIGLSVRRFPWAIVAVLTSPFILNYLNELRPYLMQIAGAAVVFNGISRLYDHAPRAWGTVLAGCLIMCASSLLGVIWAMGALLYVLAVSPHHLKDRWFWKATLWYSPPFALLGAYYAWTLLSGQGPSMMSSGIIVSLAAAGYELLGLAGLGPGKIELRVNPQALRDYAWLLIPVVLITTGVLVRSTVQWLATNPRKLVYAAILGLGIPAFLLVSLVFLKDFRLLGRHLAPVSVIIAVLIARLIATDAGTSQNPPKIQAFRFSKIAGILVLVIGLASSLSLRFASRHRKDDYRNATLIARHAIASERPVIWAADEWTAYFYGLDPKNPGWQTWNNSDPLPALPDREVVILTKPDIYDPGGRMRKLLKERGFLPVRHLTAFTVFEHPKSSSLSQ